MLNITTTDLEKLIKKNIANNYIFNMNYNDQHKTLKFNTFIEVDPKDVSFPPQKLLLALKYIPSENIFELITMY